MTIVPILWYRPNKDKEYFVKIRITDNKNVSYINLNISIPKRYWYKDRITNQHPDSIRLNNLITQTVEELKTRHKTPVVALRNSLKGYTRLSAGFYKQTTSDQASDYSWYQNAPSEFYTFAVTASGQGLRPYIPMAQAAGGVRWKGFSLGYEVQGSLTPILNTNESLVYPYTNPIRHYFIGLQLGYCYSFKI
jgi:hypothetical protein